MLVVCVIAMVTLLLSVNELRFHKKRALGFLDPIYIVIIFFFIDIYLPGLLYVTKIITPNVPNWMGLPPTPEFLFWAFAFQNITFWSLYLGYTVGAKRSIFERRHGSLKKYTFLIMISLVTIFYWGFLLENIALHGSYRNWLFNSLINRFEHSAPEGFFSAIFYKIKMKPIALYLIFIAILSRKDFSFLYYLPLVSIFLLTEFAGGSRGFFVTLGVLIIGYSIQEHKRLVLSGKVFWGLLTTFCGIIAYGIFRSATLATELNQSFGGLSQAIEIVFSGAGFISSAKIIEFYYAHSYLYGKTYLDMMLLPVPRAIYTSKPEWYGIDDITRGMGWPDSTQSAVTIFGENFANFGVWMLIPIPFVFGLLFRLLLSVRYYTINGHAVSLTMLIPMITTTSWMGYTGFTNQLMGIVQLFMIGLLLVRNS